MSIRTPLLVGLTALAIFAVVLVTNAARRDAALNEAAAIAEWSKTNAPRVSYPLLKGREQGITQLKAGTWSEWAEVSLYFLHIWPADAEAEYEYEDMAGKRTSKAMAKPSPGVRHLNDQTRYSRYRSNVDTSYSITK